MAAERAEEAWRELLARSGAERLQGLSFAARVLVEGLYAGRHGSRFTGSSVEFAGHREYVHGDDTRSIDWKLAARTGREFVRLQRIETDLDLWIALDESRSMRFPPEGEAKAAAARILAAAIASLAISQGDRVGLARFAGGISDRLVPAAGPLSLHAVLGRLARDPPRSGAEPTDIGRSLREILGGAERRGIVALISDLLDEPDSIASALDAFVARRFEVVLFHVIDPAERALPDIERARAIDIETGEILRASPREIAARYREAFASFLRRIEAIARARDLECVAVPTDAPPFAALRRFLVRRGETLRRAWR